VRRLVLLVALALALASAACAGDDGNEGTADRPATEASPEATATTADSTEDLVAEAAESTSGEGSSLVAVEATISLPGQAEQTFSAEGAFDYEKRLGSMTIDFGGAGTEVVFDDEIVYAEVPRGALPGGKSWLRIDLATLGEGSGIDLAQLAQAGQATPGQYLRWLRAAEGVERVGEEEVRGVETTHYRALIDLERLADLEPELRASLRALGTELDEVPTDVWVDEEGLVRRIVQEYETRFAGERASTRVAIDLYDFGADVEAEAPPPELVFDIADLIGGGS
jgi:hypothetical protein